MEKISKQEYLAALEAANVDDEVVLDADQDEQDQGLGELSEAERLAAHAEGPTIRVDGRPHRARVCVAKQEGTKLKALELLGKSVGLFIDKAEVKTETVTAEQLKRELGQHLKLLPSAKRSA
jgi:hypothetical protein